MKREPKNGARRVYYCRGCRQDTAQLLVSTENGDRPRAETFKCLTCRLEILNLADVPDAEGLALQGVRAHLRLRAGSGEGIIFDAIVEGYGIDFAEEITGEARMLVWAAYLVWDPARSPRFRAFALSYIGNKLTDWQRAQRGGRRRGDRQESPKAHVGAVSLDAERGDDDPRRGGTSGSDSGSRALVESLPARNGDPSRDRSPALAETLSRRGGEVAREKRRMGLDPDARVA